MNEQLIFTFQTDLTGTPIPTALNNPFGTNISELARIAAKEFQAFIGKASSDWSHDFDTQRGKMFGVLVVQKKDLSYSYLGTVSGKFPGIEPTKHLVPSVFDDTSEDCFIHAGMRELTAIGNSIKRTDNQQEIDELTEKRKQKSLGLQQQLFEEYHFLNLVGIEKSLLDIFEEAAFGRPPSAAGECAAPKLLQYAFENKLKPVALAEFWWGNPKKNNEREHLEFYPSCKNKCKPILEYMLGDVGLWDAAENEEASRK